MAFDNAVDIDGLRPFVLAAGAAQVVITSTRQAAGNLGPGVAVDVFAETEALALQATRTGLDDDAGARHLAAEMGRLPLGLAQAAAVIAPQRLGYDTYLERLRAVRLDDYLERVEGDPYPHRVAEAVVLSLEAAETADSFGAGRGVMDLMASLSSAGVSRAILHSAAAMGVVSAAGQLSRRGRGRGAEPGEMSPVDADAAIGQLARWLLLTFSRDASVISAHRLIMRVVRELRMAGCAERPPGPPPAIRLGGRFSGTAWSSPRSGDEVEHASGVRVPVVEDRGRGSAVCTAWGQRRSGQGRHGPHTRQESRPRQCPAEQATQR